MTLSAALRRLTGSSNLFTRRLGLTQGHSARAGSPDMAAMLVPCTLSVPNLSDFYAQGVTHYLSGQSRSDWLDGCARDSTVGLLWGARDRAVLCPAPWDPSLADDLARALSLRLLVHRVPENL